MLAIAGEEGIVGITAGDDGAHGWFGFPQPAEYLQTAHATGDGELHHHEIEGTAFRLSLAEGGDALGADGDQHGVALELSRNVPARRRMSASLSLQSTRVPAEASLGQ